MKSVNLVNTHPPFGSCWMPRSDTNAVITGNHVIIVTSVAETLVDIFIFRQSELSKHSIVLVHMFCSPLTSPTDKEREGAVCSC